MRKGGAPRPTKGPPPGRGTPWFLRSPDPAVSTKIVAPKTIARSIRPAHRRRTIGYWRQLASFPPRQKRAASSESAISRRTPRTIGSRTLSAPRRARQRTERTTASVASAETAITKNRCSARWNSRTAGWPTSAPSPTKNAMYTKTDGMSPAANVRRGILLTPATWVVWMRSPGIRRPMNTAGAPPRRSRWVARSSAGGNRKASAALISAGRPTEATTTRPTIAPRMVTRSRALTMGTGSTVSLAMAIPAIINSKSPGANGTGMPLSSMKTSPAMTPISRSPLKLLMEVMGFITPIAVRRFMTPMAMSVRRCSGDQLADQRNGQRPTAEKSIVESLQRVAGAALQVLAKLEDQQLAQRVVEVHRVPGTAGCLTRGGELAHVSVGFEKAYGVRHRHTATMQADRHHEPAIAQQRLEALRQLLLGIRRVNHLQHHLFHVIGKPFAGTVGPKESPRWRSGVALV